MDDFSQLLSKVRENELELSLMEQDFSKQLRAILFGAAAVVETGCVESVTASPKQKPKKHVIWSDEVIEIKEESSDDIVVENNLPPRKKILKDVTSNANFLSDNVKVKWEHERQQSEDMLATGNSTRPNDHIIKREKSSVDNSEEAQIVSVPSQTDDSIAILTSSAPVIATKKGRKKKEKKIVEKPIKVEPLSSPTKTEPGQQQAIIKIDSDLISSDAVAHSKRGRKKKNKVYIKTEQATSTIYSRTRKGQQQPVARKCEENSFYDYAVEQLTETAEELFSTAQVVIPKASTDDKDFKTDTSMLLVEAIRDASITSKTFVIVNETINDTLPLEQTPGICGQTFFVTSEVVKSRQEQVAQATDSEFFTPPETNDSPEKSKLRTLRGNYKMPPRNWTFENAVGSATRNGVTLTTRNADSATENAVGSKTRNAVNSTTKTAVGSATKNSVSSTIKSAVGSATKNPVGATTKNAVGATTRNAVGSATKNTVRLAPRNAVGSATKNSVSATTKNAENGATTLNVVGSTTKNAVRSVTRNAVGSASKIPVISTNKNAVGATTRNAGGSATKNAGHSTTRNAVALTTKNAVGSTNKNALGSATKKAVGSTATSAVDSATRNATKALRSTCTKENVDTNTGEKAISGSGRLLNSAQKRNATPISKGPAKKAPNSISKLAVPNSSKEPSRGNHSEDKRKGVQQLAKERKKQREQKYINAKECECTERFAKKGVECPKKPLESEQKNKPAEGTEENLFQEKAVAALHAPHAAKQLASKEVAIKIKQPNVHTVASGPQQALVDYTFEMLDNNHSTDDGATNSRERPPAPTWSIKSKRGAAIQVQQQIPIVVIDSFFSVQPMTVDLKQIFPEIDARHLQRNSSVIWASPTPLKITD